MARPFRFQPPALPEHTLVRPRLLAALAARWDRRVVTITAGPGFGKTVLLTAALAENRSRPVGQDVWLSCEPRDESEQHLTAGLAEALDLASDAGVEGVIDAVWACAPEPVCFVLDDLHELPRQSAGAALVDRLVTELPANAHLVLASRDEIPVRRARLAVSDQLLRIDEADLKLDPEELTAFAAARGVPVELLASTGGWPALAELVASAQTDLVLDYLWDEVLARLGRERVDVLARLAVVGGGDEDVASAVAGRPVVMDELLAGVPMVERSASGWVVLHPLWRPALLRLVSASEANAARKLAATAHERAGRLHDAVEQLAEAEDWDGVLAVLRNAEVEAITTVSAAEFGRWQRTLPARWRGEPAALLAAGLEMQARSPLDALTTLEQAAEGFRARGDVDGELAAIGQNGLVRWWTNDLGGLLGLSSRVEELAAAGSVRAQALNAVGAAAIGHMQGDSARVHAVLAGIEQTLAANWLPTALWLRSTAHRRDGHLTRARDELLVAEAFTTRHDRTQWDVAEMRIDWLAGRVDGVVDGLERIRRQYQRQEDRYLERELALELAAKHAWFGDVDAARRLVAEADVLLEGTPSVLVATLRLITMAAIAVDEGDDDRAAALLRPEVVAALDRPEAWFWRDRAAVALVHVLVPETRAQWTRQPLGPAHRPAIELAEALEAARVAELARIRELQWPDPGVVRAHLPRRWLVELAVAAVAAGNPAPDEVLHSTGDALRPLLRSVAASGRPAVTSVAKRLLSELPAVPDHRLHVRALGPLDICRDGAPVEHADLRRQRVRELLCFLVIRRRARREEVAEALWPDVDDPGRNLRTTLNYLQRILQPDRADDERPYFLRADSVWLELATSGRLEVDTWTLDRVLEQADDAEAAGSPSAALDAYRLALDLWRGEPFADAPYAEWAESERLRLRERFVASAIRAGELWLAAGASTQARAAAEAAVGADRWAERAYRLLARCHLDDRDAAGAQRAIERASAALAELGVEPDAATRALLDRVGGAAPA